MYTERDIELHTAALHLANTYIATAERDGQLESFFVLLDRKLNLHARIKTNLHIFDVAYKRQLLQYEDWHLRLLHKRASVKIDPGERRHVEMLDRMWRSCFPAVPIPGYESNEWSKALGFAGDNVFASVQ